MSTASQHGSWIRTQYLQHRRRRAQFLERLADRLLRRVAFYVDEKHIFPHAAQRGPRLDAGHGNTMFGERRQQVVQRARANRRRHQERSLVAAAARHHLAPAHQKARRVVRFVFDITRDRAETVDIGRFTARNRGRIRLGRDPARRICVAAHRDALDTSEIFIQPLPTLGEGLLMRVHASYRTQSVDAAEEIMVYAQLHLADDLEQRVEKHVERVRDHTLRGILHGHHTVVAGACFDVAKDLVDGVVRHRAHRMTEVLERRHLRERTFGPEIGDAQRLLERETGRHDLAKQARHLLSAKRPFITRDDPAQHLGLALGAIKTRASQPFLRAATSCAQRARSLIRAWICSSRPSMRVRIDFSLSSLIVHLLCVKNHRLFYKARTASTPSIRSMRSLTDAGIGLSTSISVYATSPFDLFNISMMLSPAPAMAVEICPTMVGTLALAMATRWPSLRGITTSGKFTELVMLPFSRKSRS